MYDGFGYKLTFYSGFCCFAGGLLTVLVVNKIGRVPIIVGTHFGQCICMALMALSFYYDWVWLAIASNLVYCFILYFGTLGITYVLTNEISEPFVIGLGCATNWGTKSLISYLLPTIYDNLPLYWTPMIQAMAGLFMWVLIRPLYLESKGKSCKEISDEYAAFKYSIFRI